MSIDSLWTEIPSKILEQNNYEPHSIGIIFINHTIFNRNGIFKTAYIDAKQFRRIETFLITITWNFGFPWLCKYPQNCLLQRQILLACFKNLHLESFKRKKIEICYGAKIVSISRHANHISANDAFSAFF